MLLWQPALPYNRVYRLVACDCVFVLVSVSEAGVTEVVDWLCSVVNMRTPLLTP